MTYTVGSLFTGIGGIDLAFVRAGFSIAFQVEIDPCCRAVLTKHAPTFWPDAKVFEDVRNVGRSNLPAVDVMVGGFPCQDISTAGKGAGIKEGTRSGLWLEFARIIGEIRPCFVLLENVPAITSNGGLTVISQLTTLGYDAEWGVIPAAAVGAPHRRERWWCVAVRHALGRQAPWTLEPQKRATTGTGAASQPIGMAYPHCAREQQPYRIIPELRRWSVDRSKELAYPAGLGGWSFGTELAGWSGIISPLSNGDLAHASGTGQQELNTPAKPGFAGHIARRIDSQWSAGITQSILGRAVDGLSGQLDTTEWPAGPGQQQHNWEAPRVAVGIKNRSNRLKALGNAVVPQVIQPIAEAIYEALEAAIS